MYINHGGERYGNVNCGLCTVGAIIGATSDQVAAMIGHSGNQSAEIFGSAASDYTPKQVAELTQSEQQDLSLKGMKNFVKQVMNYIKRDCFITQGGSWDSLVPMKTQIGLMGIYPVGTQYAVYGCMEMRGLGAHWNYATRTDKGVEFRDYQYNDSETNLAETSATFIPPRGMKKFGTDDYTQGIVLVFRSTKKLI